MITIDHYITASTTITTINITNEGEEHSFYCLINVTDLNVAKLFVFFFFISRFLFLSSDAWWILSISLVLSRDIPCVVTRTYTHRQTQTQTQTRLRNMRFSVTRAYASFFPSFVVSLPFRLRNVQGKGEPRGTRRANRVVRNNRHWQERKRWFAGLVDATCVTLAHPRIFSLCLSASLCWREYSHGATRLELRLKKMLLIYRDLIFSNADNFSISGPNCFTK